MHIMTFQNTFKDGVVTGTTVWWFWWNHDVVVCFWLLSMGPEEVANVPVSYCSYTWSCSGLWLCWQLVTQLVLGWQMLRPVLPDQWNTGQDIWMVIKCLVDVTAKGMWVGCSSCCSCCSWWNVLRCVAAGSNWTSSDLNFVDQTWLWWITHNVEQHGDVVTFDEGG